MNPVYCSACGHRNVIGAKFCNECATPLFTPSQSAQPSLSPLPAEVADSQVEPTESVRVTIKLGLAYQAGAWWAKQDMPTRMGTIGIGIVAVVVMVLIPVVLFTNTSKPKSGFTSPSESSSSPTRNTPASSSSPQGLPPASRLASAKIFLAGRVKKSDLSQATSILNEIKPEAAEYQEAQQLLSQIKSGKIKPISDFEEEHFSTIETLRRVNREITIEKLKKNASRYTGDVWAFSGRVLQIFEEGNATGARIGTGSWDAEAVWVEASFTTEFVEDNRVFVVGTLQGTHSYTSQAGWEITIPKLTAVAIVKPADGAKLKAMAGKSK